MSETTPLSGDRVKVTVVVQVEPAVAFEVFTEEVDLWWRRGPKYRFGGRSPGVLEFEPGAGGRLFERFDDPESPRVFEVGRITAWEPPARLVFEWRGPNFKPGERTEVEVRFEPYPTGTRVILEHRGFRALRPDHPVRHGLESAAFIRMMGLWWGELMSTLRERIASR